MNRETLILAAGLLLGAGLVLGASVAMAQSSGGGGSGGGSSGGSAGGAGGSSASSGASRGGGAGSMAPRAGSTSGATQSDPRALSNQPATAADPGSAAPGTYAPGGGPAPGGTQTPSGTAYPSGPALDAARQRAMQSPPGSPAAIPPSAPGTGGERTRTLEPGRNPDIEATTPGVPGAAQDPRVGVGEAERAGGGTTAREGAAGKTMAECEEAWDPETHMSKAKWRETCRRTLTEPHL